MDSNTMGLPQVRTRTLGWALVAAALLSFQETLVRKKDLLERLDEFREHLLANSRSMSPQDVDSLGIFERAWRMLAMRRLAVLEGDAIIVLPKQRPLLEFYANSVIHLLPSRSRNPAMTPALDPDESLPRL